MRTLIDFAAEWILCGPDATGLIHPHQRTQRTGVFTSSLGRLRNDADSTRESIRTNLALLPRGSAV